MTARRTLLSLAAAAGLALAAAGCASGSPEQPRATIVRVQASDSGGASDAGGAEAAGGPAIIPGDLDLSTVTDACSTEGMVEVTADGAEPAIEADGKPVPLRYKGPTEVDGLNAAVFTIDLGSGPETMAPARLGDRFEVGGKTYAVSSVCGDNAELDIVE